MAATCDALSITSLVARKLLGTSFSLVRKCAGKPLLQCEEGYFARIFPNSPEKFLCGKHILRSCFLDVTQKFWRIKSKSHFFLFCPNFQGFCPNFRQVKTFKGALTPPHPSSYTSDSFQLLTRSSSFVVLPSIVGLIHHEFTA